MIPAPPAHFRFVSEPLASARLSPQAPPFNRGRKRTAAQSRGIRYERKAQEYLLSQFREFYVPSPWLHFREEGAENFRWCQPDGLLIDGQRGIINIVEIKYSHTSDAWWQLKNLYLPVLKKIFPIDLWSFEMVEVVRWYDPDVFFPEPVCLANNPLKPSTKFKVHIFNP